MTKTAVSSKFQVVIPKEVRDSVPLKRGQKLIVYEKDGVIFMVPEISVKKLKGIFKKELSSADIRSVRDKSGRQK